VNNQQVAVLEPEFTTRGVVGAFVESGRNNVAYFRQPLVQVLPVNYSMLTNGDTRNSGVFVLVVSNKID